MWIDLNELENNYLLHLKKEFNLSYMKNTKKGNSGITHEHYKVFAPKKEKDLEGFIRSIVPELLEADGDVINTYIQNLTKVELLFLLGISRFPKNETKHDLRNYPLGVQKCLNETNNFLLFKFQLENLFILSGGKKKEATSFIRNWIKKTPSTRDGFASEMHIGNYSLKQIIENLAYDSENFFVIGEDADLARQLMPYDTLDVEENKILRSTSLTYILYNGDVNGEKRLGISLKTKTHIAIKGINENEFWVSLMILKDDAQNCFYYNLLDVEKVQKGIQLINPTFYQNLDSCWFFFIAKIEWIIDGKFEYFEFSERFRGEMPSYIQVIDVI